LDLFLDYYLLSDSAKNAFLGSVKSISDFNALVENIENLFTDNPLMYAQGDYLEILNQFLQDLVSKKNKEPLKERILLDDVLEKSGITFSNVDGSTIKLQNSLPRKSQVLVYKKSFYDRDVNLTEIPNFRENNPQVNLVLEPSINSIAEMHVGNQISVINANAAAVENNTESGPITLPTNSPAEFAVEYEVVVIGSGTASDVARDFTEREREIFGNLNIEAYVLDYFLPALLDIGGNKSLLEQIDESVQQDLLNELLPTLQQYPTILENVRNNKFKDASEAWFPQLYDDVRLSNDLRTVLGNVYNVLSNNGNSPNTFIQSQELIEIGLPRTEIVMKAIYSNMNFSRKSNLGQLRTTAKVLEQWTPFSVDAEVDITAANTQVCLGDATELTATIFTLSDPEVETLEFHWSSADNFGGRIQDINGDPNNFGTEIVTEERTVSYISAALESELGDNDNIETIELKVMARNTARNDLTELGSATIEINNLKNCQSFNATFERQPNIREIESSSCTGGIVYQAMSPITYTADFQSVDGAIGYLGIITRSNGIVNDEVRLDDDRLEDLGNGMLRYNTAVGRISIFNSCDEAEAIARAQEFVDNISVEPVSIEITPIF